MKTAKEMSKYTDKYYKRNLRKAKRKISSAFKSAAKQGCYGHTLTFHFTNEAIIDDLTDWLTSLGYRWEECHKACTIEVFWSCVDSKERN